ncbi:MAG TPA: hypothetical protein VNH15_05480 [Elusimicrobiota bacterium]|jgi:hypothetical protein|nr:hypothetical protein [Elusimicrobiota bacterium]
MKLSSLPIAVLTLSLLGAAAQAEVYYYAGNRKVTVTKAQADAMTEPQIAELCGEITASAEAVKKIDVQTSAQGDLVRQYVRDNYDGLQDISDYAAVLAPQPFPSPASSSSLSDIAAQALAVARHNAIAAQGSAKVDAAQQSLLKTAGVTDICKLEYCGLH